MKKLFGFERKVETKGIDKVFISGPMTGYEDYNRKAFDDAEIKLKELGYAVFNPAWLKFDCEEWTHDEIMNIDLAALKQCDFIYQLPGWSESEGALEEDSVAYDYDIKKLDLGQFDI